MDYSDSGFDDFLSRSIDGTPQRNLDTGGPVSTQMRYDSAQSSGSVGDTFSVGNVLINGKDGAIELANGTNRPLLIGKDSNGNDVVKVAQPGYDAQTARDDQLSFNSLQNTLKIVKTDTLAVPVGTAVTNWVTTPHNLGFAPIPLAFLTGVGITGIFQKGNLPLPTYTSLNVEPDGTKQYGPMVTMRTWLNVAADEQNFYVLAFNSLGTAFTVNVKYYLLQESSN